MIRGIGIQNFRSFVDRTFIDIKPITVFVGKNSSGKSSLLRTFPLLR
ncbi:TPA: AAA family ATPase, partial [Salmonella enterica subsp. enterica serovar Bareilly]